VPVFAIVLRDLLVCLRLSLLSVAVAVAVATAATAALAAAAASTAALALAAAAASAAASPANIFVYLSNMCCRLAKFYFTLLYKLVLIYFTL
jgi:hypothetical protein